MIVDELEGQLSLVRSNLPSKDQTQLGAKDDSQKYADISDINLTWRNGKRAPQRMYRCCNATVDETLATVYFSDCLDTVVYCYNTSSDLWTRLPNCPNLCSSFIVINNMLTTVGGAKNGQDSNKLYSLKEGGAWVEEFPPMPTRRSSATAICTESSLIVMGGYGLRSLVEVMSITSRQWSIAAAVPTYI